MRATWSLVCSATLMHGLTFLQDLAVVMIVAGLVTLLFHRFKQPVVLGYILAGFIIGPHTPPFPLIQDEESIKILAELGIIFLMFSLGMEFNLRKLTQVGAPAIVAALLEILVLFLVGYEIGRWFGWSSINRIFLGAMLSMSSTTVIIKVLTDMGYMKERFAHLIFGILIIEDIMGIAMIALLSSIAMTGSLGVGEVGLTLARLGVFLAVVLVLGLLTVPRLIGYVARFKSDEMLVIAVLGLCFGVSLLAVKLGYSVALGAFLIGAVIAEARDIHRVTKLIEPVRDLFSAVFFVAIGMLIDLRMVVDYAWPIVAITCAVVFGKIITCSLGTFAAGVDARTSLRVGSGLAQIGEFSFIIASLGLTLGVTGKFLYPIAVSVSALTTLFTPHLIKQSDRLGSLAVRVVPRALIQALELYSRWVRELSRASPRHPGLRFVKSLVGQLLLNVMLIAGAFIAAAFAVSRVAAFAPFLNRVPGGAQTACWAAAVAVTLPIYVATIRKAQALCMLLSEISISTVTNRSRSQALRTAVANLLFATSVAALGLLTIFLSWTILPRGYMLVGLLVVITLAVFFFGTHFNRLYSRAKFALVETWDNPPLPEREAVLLPMLQAAALEQFVVPAGPLSGRLIRELNLRARTGVSIVAMDRGGKPLVNPGPDDELQAGDRLLLLGERPHLQRALALLGQFKPVEDAS